MNQATSCSVDIACDYDGWHDYIDQHSNLFEQLALSTFEASGFHNALTADAEISLLLTDDEHITKLNLEYRNKNTPTNVLSFPSQDHDAGNYPPLHESELLLGDIIIAYQTTERESIDASKNFDHHVAHLFVHGLLHLIGYDHQTDAQADIMEALEVAILKQHDIDNPYENET